MIHWQFSIGSWEKVLDGGVYPGKEWAVSTTEHISASKFLHAFFADF
jgi:hypothetical protein